MIRYFLSVGIVLLSLLPENVTRIDHAVIPLYLEADTETVAVMRADSIVASHQRRGFFRIGLLPLIVVENLSIQINDRERLLPALVASGHHFVSKTDNKKIIEARNFSLAIGTNQFPAIVSQTMRPQTPELWMLEHGKILIADGKPLIFDKARLTILGPRAGEVTLMQADTVMTVNLSEVFKSQTTPKP